MSILKWKVILKMQHTLLIATKCLNGYFFLFFMMIKDVLGVGGLTWLRFWQFCIRQSVVVLWTVHTNISIHTDWLSFVFALVFSRSQQQVKLLQIIASGQPLLLSVRCRLILSACSLWDSKFLLLSFFSCCESFQTNCFSQVFRYKQWLFHTVHM